MAMWLDYKPTRYEGKGFLHRDITGDRCGLWWGKEYYNFGKNT